MSLARFSPKIWATLGAVAGIVATLWLGFWQLDRAARKFAIAETYERLALRPGVLIGATEDEQNITELQNVRAVGHFDPQTMILLDNRVRRGVVGYEVIMLLRLPRGAPVLVNRGWIAGSRARQHLPEVNTPVGEVAVSGRVSVPGKRIYELSGHSIEGRVWQNISIERFRAHAKIDVRPFVIQQTNDLGDGLNREWPAPDAGVNTHKSYAVQWFALAGLILVVYIVTGVRRDANRA
jgi:surfeit locus 1 family protein